MGSKRAKRLERQERAGVNGAALTPLPGGVASAEPSTAPTAGSHYGHQFASLSIFPVAPVGRQVVQRDGPGVTVGDWELKPEFPRETDDRYDTPENQRRAEQKEADERGQSAKPNEWWKPKTPTVPPLGPYQDPNIWKPKGSGEAPTPLPLPVPPWLLPPWLQQGPPPAPSGPLGPGDFPLPEGDERNA